MTSDTDTPASRLVIEAVRAALGRVPASSSDSLFAVALSGGLDSTVLLDAAVRCAGASRVVALHVHHGLSPNADAWSAHCEAFADSLGVRFAARSVDVVRASGESLEAAARDARYRALDQLCDEHGAHALWLAHHADDQAETVLLQLLRGAGVAGLAAMAPERIDGTMSVPRVRPLLNLLRAQLEHYAHERDLNWIDDESNVDTRYARNALRHDVLPVLAVHFPGFRDALARTASHAASAQRLLDELARIDLDMSRATKRARSRSTRCSRSTTNAPSTCCVTGCARAACRRHRRRASPTCCGNCATRSRRATATRLRIDHAGHCLREYRGSIFWEQGDSADPADLDEGARRAEDGGRIAMAGRRSVAFAAMARHVRVRARAMRDRRPMRFAESVLRSAPLPRVRAAGGERMRLAADAPSRTLKNLFQERGVPAWKRDVPLLFVGETLLFVPLIGVNRDALPATAPTRRVRSSGASSWRPDLDSSA